MKFEELASAPELVRAIRELGWETPTPIQSKAIPPAKQGRDLVGIAQTGTGKTAAFLIPAIEKQIQLEGLHTLVLCPTRELAQQVAADARALTKHTELWVGEVVGGMPMRPQTRDLRAGFDILVATPGRLLDHLERGNVKLRDLKTLVLDEADRMLDMGFRPQIDRILEMVPKERQTLFFSATMPNGVHAMALRILREPEWIEVSRPSTAATTVDQSVYSVRPDRKSALLIELLKEPEMDQVLVFTRTKHGADLLIGQLKRANVSAAVMHGDRDMKDRRKALELFEQGHVQVLVATDVAQRGLDIEGITHVINFDVPRDPEDYVHRIGRTGRAGASGTAYTFVTAADLGQLKDIERTIGYKLDRVSIPEFDYEGGGLAVEQAEAPKINRSGSRMGARSAKDLTPEQLKELLKVG